jgi:hypothetical protein
MQRPQRLICDGCGKDGGYVGAGAGPDGRGGHESGVPYPEGWLMVGHWLSHTREDYCPECLEKVTKEGE